MRDKVIQTMPAKPRDSALTIRLTEDEREKLEWLAVTDGLSLSDILRQGLRAYWTNRFPDPSKDPIAIKRAAEQKTAKKGGR